MRAWRVTVGGGIDGLEQVALPDPQPGPGEVLIRVRATSLNYRDLGVVRASRELRIPLSDGAGEVVAVGPGVREFAVGDHVAGCFFTSWPDGEGRPEYTRDSLGGPVDGMLAELVVLPVSGVIHAPSHMSHEEVATLPCAALTAWNGMFEEARLRPGSSILLLGTGGVSIFGLQLAVLSGLRAIVTSSSDEKLARAKELGAHETINYRTTEDWDRAVLDLTGGRGVDAVLEVGGASTFARSMAATRLGGHVVLIGGLGGQPGEGASVPLPGRVHATRIYVGSKVMFERMNGALALHEVRPVIDRLFPFEEAREAYRHLESQTHLGKVVITV